MTNLQLYLAIGLPTLAVLTTLVVNIITMSGIREYIREIRDDIREIRADLKILTGKVAEIDTRLTVLEGKL